MLLLVGLGNPGAKVAHFDGRNDHLRISDVGLKGKSFTIEFWVKRELGDKAGWICFQPAVTTRGINLSKLKLGNISKPGKPSVPNIPSNSKKSKRD